MIKPTISELTKGEMNRYELVIAIAKCARMVTDEYVAQRERAEEMVANRETEKPLASLIAKEYRDEKAVKTAINRFHGGRYQVVPAEESAIEE
jgi:DNA-directed RNA polymerase subunit K/omega